MKELINKQLKQLKQLKQRSWPAMFSYFLLLVLTLGSGQLLAKEVVNIYSARHYDTDIALYKDFEERTGIKINLIEAASDALIERIVNEGKYSPADILITVDAGRLYRAEQRGIFSPVSSGVLDQRVPAHLRHPDGLWFGLSKRARVIIYNRETQNPENLQRYSDLASPSLKNQVCMRSSENIYNISLMAAMVEHWGAEQAEQWARAVVSNLYKRPSGNDTANIRAVASGECGASLVNSYYVARLLESEKSLTETLGIIYPDQQSRGTHINISGAGVLKHAPNRSNAIKFIEYLTEPRSQTLYVAGNHEYPIVADAEITGSLASLGEFKEDQVNANALGVNQAEAVRVYDRAGWR